MKFRDMEITDIIVLEDCSKEDLQDQLKEMAEKYFIVDLQFSTTRDEDGMNFHSALALVRDLKGEK